MIKDYMGQLQSVLDASEQALNGAAHLASESDHLQMVMELRGHNLSAPRIFGNNAPHQEESYTEFARAASKAINTHFFTRAQQGHSRAGIMHLVGHASAETRRIIEALDRVVRGALPEKAVNEAYKEFLENEVHATAIPDSAAIPEPG